MVSAKHYETIFLPIPVVLGATSQPTFLHNRVIFYLRAHGIRQWILERHEQVVETPGDDHVVINAHQQGYHDGAVPHPTQVRVNNVPHTHRSLAQTLTNGELHEKEWYAK